MCFSRAFSVNLWYPNGQGVRNIIGAEFTLLEVGGNNWSIVLNSASAKAGLSSDYVGYDLSYTLYEGSTNFTLPMEINGQKFNIEFTVGVGAGFSSPLEFTSDSITVNFNKNVIQVSAKITYN